MDRPEFPDRDDYPKDMVEWNVARQKYYADLAEFWAQKIGYTIVPEYVDGAVEFCSECAACWGEPEPNRGKDSWGDCAADGETVYWAVKHVDPS